FKEAESLAFKSGSWQNYTLSHNDESLWFYLEEGINIIGLEVNSAPFRDIYDTVNEVMRGVNDIAIDIKKLTGNQIDENRDWEIVDYMPNLASDLNHYADLIFESYNSFKQVSNTTKDADIASG